MGLPVPSFAALPAGNQPLSLLDQQFTAVANGMTISCTGAGANTIALTPNPNNYVPTTYTSGAPRFVWVQQSTSTTGPVTLNVASIGPITAYKANGTVALGGIAGELVAGSVYTATYSSALTSGAGGFTVDVLPAQGPPGPTGPAGPLGPQGPVGPAGSPANIGTSSAFDNFIVNSTMELSQENGTNSVAVPTSSTHYIVDQWQVSNYSGISFTGLQTTVTPTSGMLTGFALDMYCTAAVSAPGATNFALFQHPIEGQRFERAQFGTAVAQSVTISFWVNATVTGTFSVSLRNGAVNRSYVANLSYTGGGYQYFTVTIPGDTAGTWAKDNTAGVYLGFSFLCGTNTQTTPGAWQAGNFVGTSANTNFFASVNNSVYLTGVVMTLGTVAPQQATQGYMYRGADEESHLCLRYYQINRERMPGFLSSGVGTTNVGFIFNHSSIVPFRIAPAVSLIQASVSIECAPWSNAYTMSSITLNSSAHTGFYGTDVQLLATSSASIPAPLYAPATIVASGMIKFDARM